MHKQELRGRDKRLLQGVYQGRGIAALAAGCGDANMSTDLANIAKAENIMLPEVAAARMRLFEGLKMSLLTDSDIQTIKTKDGKERSFIKRSGFRKLALAFNISDEIISKEQNVVSVPDDKGPPYTIWTVTVKATASNGRSSLGLGSCSSRERAFAHPDHDILATAHTRAKNRAISDLIGSGEISAEEIEQEQPKQVFFEPTKVEEGKGTKTIEEVFKGRLDGTKK